MEFVSPLTVNLEASPFSLIDFGRFIPDPKIGTLADRLEEKLMLAVGDLPPSMSKEAKDELKAYACDRLRFVDLFYVPIWSFLHWVPENTPDKDIVHMLEIAREAHALSLFLHLWDDHLSDRQLPPTLMRLHLRAVVWERYHAAVRVLAAAVPAGDEIVARLVEGYLTSCHEPPPVTDQKSFCDRFMQQIGIWLVVPTLLGHLIGGQNTARDLCTAIGAFALAWRMIDDVQDIDKDIVSGQQNAVWFELDGNGRQAWENCRAASEGRANPEAETWKVALSAIFDGALQSVLGQTVKQLAKAQTVADNAGWNGLAAELAACRNLQGFEEAGLRA